MTGGPGAPVTGGPPIRRIAYLGTPALAQIPLRRLVDAGVEVAVVVTAPPKRRGRGSATSLTPVHGAAVELGLPVSHDPAAVLDCGAEAGVVVAYGRILRPPVLGAMPLLNLHFSLLPRWRGAAPVERAILAGDAETGVCVMAIDAGLDTGPVYARATTEVDDKTLSELWDELAGRGADLLVDLLAAGLGEPVAQDTGSTHAAKLDASDRHVDPRRDDAEMARRRVRLGGAWTTFRGERLGLADLRPRPAIVEEGAPVADPGAWLDGTRFAVRGGSVIELVSVQPAGKPVLPADAWARGARLVVGDRLGDA